MACYFRSTVLEFLATSDTEVLSALTLAYAADGFAEMRTELALTWWNDLDSVREALRGVCDARRDAERWFVCLEFTIPRKQRRIDLVLLDGERIILIECKTGELTAEALRQVEEYALLLHYFHKPSDRKKILPIVVTRAGVDALQASRRMESLSQGELGFDALPRYWIAPTQISSWDGLAALLLNLPVTGLDSIDGESWNNGAYHPTPTIIDAALALRTGLKIREIALSEAAEHDIDEVTEAIRKIVQDAQSQREHVICFLTGVPGSGKTLVGLSLAHLSESRTDAIHFMSGNGPLVAVL
jgi:hypothetical protein